MAEQRRATRRVVVDGVTGNRRESGPPRSIRPVGSPPGTSPAVGAPTPFQATAEAERLDQNRQDLQARVSNLLGVLAHLEDGLPVVARQQVAVSGQRLEDVRRETTESRRRLLEQADRSVHEAGAVLDRRLDEAIARCAPGAASASWDEFLDAPDRPTPSDAIRIGTARGLHDRSVPALVPFAGSAGWYVSGTEGDRNAFVLAALTRLIAQVPPRLLSIHTFDPRVSGVLGQLAGLRRVHSSVFPAPVSDPRGFSEIVNLALEDGGRNAERAVAAGRSGLIDLWQTAAIPEGTMHVLVVLDYPYGASSELTERLVHAATVAGRTGLLLLVAASPEADPGAAGELAVLLRRLELGAETVVTDGFRSDRPIRSDPAVPSSIVQQVIDRAARRAEEAKGPVVPLVDLLADDLAAPWGHSADQAIEFPLGTAGGATVELSLRTENPPLPNILIGGAVGQGKTNLLLTIIYGMACRYGPDDLSLYLLDFKQGLEFRRFDGDGDGRGWLPHARVLGLESNHAFGAAVLRHVHSEMERRSVAFKRAGAASIDAYRRSGAPPVPRLVLVIDEFHVLFDGDGDGVDECIALLEGLAKQGRAYGIHLILASQAISGIRSLASKIDAIFSQFPLRIALKNTPAESEAFLSQGNKAAAQLSYRGQAIVNRNFGLDPERDNEIALIAWADPDAVAELQQRLWQLDPRKPPVVFVGSGPAPWNEDAFRAHAARAHDGSLRLWIGRPIDVSDRPRTLTLSPDADQTLAVIGSAAPLARSVLRSAALTAIAGLTPGGRLTLLDGLEEAGQPWFAEVTRVAEAASIQVTVIERGQAAAHLSSVLGPRLGDLAAANELVIGCGMQRLPHLDERPVREVDDSDPDGYLFDGPPTPRELIGELAQRGALAGVFFIGWWNNLRGLEADLGNYAPAAQSIVTAGIALADLRAIGGPHTPAIDGHPRVGLFDRSKDVMETLVPFESASIDLLSHEEDEE